MRSLKNFLAPEKIAVVGASENPEKVGYALMKKLLRFRGKIIPVNIKHDFVFGIKTISSVKECKEKIDLAIIAIPSEGVKKIIEECAEKKIKNIIIISAGFSETGDKKEEDEIKRIAEKNKMNVLGPNCFGIANPYLNLDTTFAKSGSAKGNIAFISQSGALWSYISDISASKKNPGFSGFVSLGNMADLDFSDFIEYFKKDRKTKKIVLYIEKIKDGKRFIRVCKNSKKQIIAVKAGKSEEGKKATISHTGSLATDFEIYRGAFRQAGIKMEDSLGSALGIKMQKINLKKLKKGRTAIITNAGGAGALMTDYLTENGFAVDAPIDLIGTAMAKDYEKALKKLKNNYENIFVILTPQTMSEPEKTAESVSRSEKKKKITAFFLGEKSVEKAEKILKKNKIKYYTRI